MKVAIIGTNGLLSNSFGTLFSKLGYELHMYGLKEPEAHLYTSFTEVDLLDHFDCKSLVGCDLIVYAVGAGIQSDLKESATFIYNLNVSVPINLCIGLKESNYKGVFITFGSYFEIGKNDKYKMFNEVELLNSTLGVPNDYSISKRVLSRFISSFNAPFKNWHFILPTIYGELESARRLIPYTLNAIKNNLEVHYTSGEQIRQYIYIDEIPLLVIKSIEKNIDSGIYNIAGTETFSVKELVTLLFNLNGAELPIDAFGSIDRVDNSMKVLMLNGQKLCDAVEYAPSVLIKDVYRRYLTLL